MPRSFWPVDAARRGHPSHGRPPALNEVDPCTDQGFVSRPQAAVSGTLVLLCLMSGQRTSVVSDPARTRYLQWVLEGQNKGWRLGWVLEEAWIAPAMCVPKGLGDRLDA